MRVLSQETPNSTNNREQLSGILMAIQDWKQHFADEDCIIWSDSAYSINCCTVWVENWMCNGWKTSKKKPVENQDLIKTIYALLEEHPQISLQKVAGHDGEIFNEIADAVASGNAKKLAKWTALISETEI